MDPTTCSTTASQLLLAYSQLDKICMGTGGIGRTSVKFDRTNLALYWQFDSTSEKVISSPAVSTAVYQGKRGTDM